MPQTYILDATNVNLVFLIPMALSVVCTNRNDFCFAFLSPS